MKLVSYSGRWKKDAQGNYTPWGAPPPGGQWANPGATPSSATHVIHSWHGGLADIDEGNQLRVTFTIPDLSQNQFETTFAESRFFQATLYVLGNYHP